MKSDLQANVLYYGDTLPILRRNTSSVDLTMSTRRSSPRR